MGSTENQADGAAEEQSAPSMPMHTRAILDAAVTLNQQLNYAVTLAMACGEQLLQLGAEINTIKSKLVQHEQLLDGLLGLSDIPGIDTELPRAPTGTGMVHPPFDDMAPPR